MPKKPARYLPGHAQTLLADPSGRRFPLWPRQGGGIGGALPVMVGLQNRAPVWMQKTSAEWLYRLFQEPKRLFKRYAYTNTLFIYLILKEKLKR